MLIFIVLCCLTLATFWTFPLDRNRILIGLFNMAIGVAWLAYMRARLPGAGGQIPMIGKQSGMDEKFNTNFFKTEVRDS